MKVQELFSFLQPHLFSVGRNGDIASYNWGGMMKGMRSGKEAATPVMPIPSCDSAGSARASHISEEAGDCGGDAGFPRAAVEHMGEPVHCGDCGAQLRLARHPACSFFH